MAHREYLKKKLQANVITAYEKIPPEYPAIHMCSGISAMVL